MELDRTQGDFLFNHDLPHENVMDRLGIELEDLDSSLRAKIGRIDDLYQNALKDGIDEHEEKLLITESYKIAEEIETYFEKNNSNDSGGLSIIGGLLLLIGGAIGIKKLME